MNSSEYFTKSKNIVPGGVHSPVRSFKGLKSTPLFFNRGEGAYIYDVEGNDYIDFCMSFGPLILGHGDKNIKETLHRVIDKATSFGACSPYEYELAEFIIERIGKNKQIRFMNSGTEAVMTAIRLARAYTGRDKIIKFNGCYHGHSDSMLIKAGSGLAGTSEASSQGIPKSILSDTIILELADIDAVRKTLSMFRNQIAAIIIEPLPANNGLLIQEEIFLHQLSSLAKEFDTLLIFDEVISGFRVSFGGMAQRLKIDPDLSTYGKIIGGGLPVGAVMGSKEIMEKLAPLGLVYQAGTLSGNPLAMSVGLTALKQLTETTYKDLRTSTQNICNAFNHWFKTFNQGKFKDYHAISYESLFWIYPDKELPKSASKISGNLAEKFTDLFEELLSRKIYLAPNAYEVSFCSTSHNSEVLKELNNRLWK